MQAGWFSAYRGLAARDDLHAVLHLGDYLYEYGPGQYGYGQDNADIRPHEPGPRDGLAGRLPAAARAVQDATPTCRTRTRSTPGSSRGTTTRSPTTSGGDGGENHQRRARATTARAGPAPTARTTSGCRCGWTAPPGSATATRLFRRLRFGRLAELSMLDLRTYRSEQVASPAPPAPWPPGEVSDPDRTITGDRQLDVAQGLAASHRAARSGRWSATR